MISLDTFSMFSFCSFAFFKNLSISKKNILTFGANLTKKYIMDIVIININPINIYPKNTHIPVSISRVHGKVNNGV